MEEDEHEHRFVHEEGRLYRCAECGQAGIYLHEPVNRVVEYHTTPPDER